MVKPLPLEKVIFMKVGRHAGEDFEQILERKRREVTVAGRTFWGYGGSTCHPLTQVRPFVRSVVEQGGHVHILMEPMDSKADPDVVPATEFSEDGINWKPLPSGIVVTGSRYAIVLGEIKPAEFVLPLSKYSVGLGKSEGKAASDYIQGRVDKACLTLTPPLVSPKKSDTIAKIGYSAEILEPYAVMLRGRQPRQ